MTTPDGVQYFTSTKFTPPALLRRDAQGDQAFVNGQWRPTTSIVDYMAGNDDHVDDVSEADARKFAPQAFA
jgi:hypothetical protein